MGDCKGAMENKVEIYEMFLKKCDNICCSKYLMSSNAINSLLQFMPKFSCVMEFVSKCNQGENYKQLVSQSGEGNVFKMPKSKKKIVALVTGLLFDIDQMNIDINSFLIRYFYSADDEFGYQAFCKVIVRPYAEAFGMMLENFEEEDDIEKLENNLPIADKKISEQVFPLVNSLKDCVLADSKLANNKRNDCLTMLEGLEYAFELGSAKMINVVFVGLKSVFAGYKNGNSFMLTIEELLKLYSI